MTPVGVKSSVTDQTEAQNEDQNCKRAEKGKADTNYTHKISLLIYTLEGLVYS